MSFCPERTGCTLESSRRMGITGVKDELLSLSMLHFIADSRKLGINGNDLNSSEIGTALLLVVSALDAFLSESIARSIAAEKTIVEEFRIAQSSSVYPIMAEIIASPTIG